MISLIIDTETSGLPQNKDLAHPDQPWICEIALIRMAEGRIIGTTQTLLQPGLSKMNPFAQAAHGMTTEFISQYGCNRDETTLELIESAFQSCDQIIGHNLDFDIKMFDILFGHDEYRYSDIPYICTMKASTDLLKLPKTKGSGYKYPKLTELYEHLFCKPLPRAHSALGDALATMECYLKLKEMGVIE